MNSPHRLTLRKAAPTDLDFIVEIDLKDGGVTLPHLAEAMPEELADHRGKIAAFIADTDKAAWVYEDTGTGRLIGIILWRYRNRLREKDARIAELTAALEHEREQSRAHAEAAARSHVLLSMTGPAQQPEPFFQSFWCRLFRWGKKP